MNSDRVEKTALSEKEGGAVFVNVERRQYARRIPNIVPIMARLGTDTSAEFFNIINISEKGFSGRTSFSAPIGSYVRASVLFPGNVNTQISVRIVRRRVIQRAPLLHDIGVMVMERLDVENFRTAVQRIEGPFVTDRRQGPRRNRIEERISDNERRGVSRRGHSSIARRLSTRGNGLDRWGSNYTYERVLQSACGGRITTQGRSKIMLGSNSYLGLTDHPRVKEGAIRAIERFGAGAGGVRVLSGTMTLHRELEERLAAFKGTESCLILPSGYSTNFAVLTSLLEKNDIVFCDERNHASIVDGCRASGATMRFYRHNDMVGLEKKLRQYNSSRGKLIITDGIFSMDGDAASLKDIVGLGRSYGAMTYVDDAHGTGVVGAKGHGTAEHCGVMGQIDITVATLSKALGAIGGAVCGSRAVVKHVTHHARSFIFTSALPPSVCGAVLAALDVIDEDPSLLQNLNRNRDMLVKGLRNIGYNVPDTVSAIIPVIIGDEEKTYKLANLLDEMNVFVNAVSRPAVPRELSRLRISAMACHSPSDMEEALLAFKNAGRILGVV